MTQQVCPNCRQANNLQDQYCRRCGEVLTAYPLSSGSRPAITIGSGSLLPAPTLKQVGQAVAVSLAALAAEAALSWLRRRVQRMERPEEKSVALVPRREAPEPPKTVVSRRVVQVWRRGKLASQLIEQSVWQEME